jgi:hypothetical protein
MTNDASPKVPTVHFTYSIATKKELMEVSIKGEYPKWMVYNGKS